MSVFKPIPLLRICTLCLLLTAFSVGSYASPAYRGPVTMTQPDGSTFVARLIGDEFIKIKTTLTGHAIVQGDDGWWYYGIYDESTRLTNSGIKVGQTAPAASLHIPYEALSRQAMLKRTSLTKSSTEPQMKRFMRSQGCVADTRAMNTSKEKHAIVILAQFKDISFKNSRDRFVELMTKSTSSGLCAKEYFENQFQNTISFKFDVSEIVTLPKIRSYYGKNNADGHDLRPEEMVTDACSAASKNGVDFSKYDDDGDGEVDNVFVFFAGEDEAEGGGDDCIWSHAWYIKDGAGKVFRLNGVLINSYACTSELTRVYTNPNTYRTQLAGIGTFCHEYSHALGVADMYDTDYETNGVSGALWYSTNLMDGGNNNGNGRTPPDYSAIQHDELEYFTPVIIDGDGCFVLEDIATTGTYFRIDTETPGEYFLIERRGGVFIYHIDKSDRNVNGQTARDKWTIYNTVNSYSGHQCADMIECDGRNDQFTTMYSYYSILETHGATGLAFPYGNRNSCTLKSWNGQTVFKIEVSDTHIIVSGTGKKSQVPAVTDFCIDAFQTEAVLTFRHNSPYGNDGKAVIRKIGEEYGETIEIAPYKTGSYTTRLRGLEPGTTYEVKFWFEDDRGKGQETNTSFTTYKMKGHLPYIYLGSKLTTDMRNEDGSFSKGAKLPLVVFDAKDVESIQWEFNGSSVEYGEDGYFSIPHSGKLKATIRYKSEGTVVNTEELVKMVRIQ